MRIKRAFTLTEQIKMVGPDWVTIKESEYSLTTVRCIVHRLRQAGYQIECKQSGKKGVSKIRRISNDSAANV